MNPGQQRFFIALLPSEDVGQIARQIELRFAMVKNLSLMSTNERPYLATVARIAAQELKSLGAKNVRPDFTVVHFTGDKALLYLLNLWARTIFLVLMPIKEVVTIESNYIRALKK